MTDNDFYAILGVLPSAEEVVIRAAYKALAQRYHPDRWSGAAEESHSKMSRINAAYAVLADSQKRAEYDRSRASGATGNFAAAEDDESPAFDNAMNDLEERWNLAVTVFSDLTGIRSRMRRISKNLEFAFVTELIENRSFEKRESVAARLEKEFLTRFFGTNPEILKYSLELIESGERSAVQFLNKLVDTLGFEIDPFLIIDRVDKKFEINSKRLQKQKEIVREQEIRFLASRVMTYGYQDHAFRIAYLLGYKITRKNGGWIFTDPGLDVVTPSGESLSIKNGAALVHWIKENVCKGLL